MGRQFTPTEAQKKAIEHDRGPATVTGGPGTGKSEVLARRIEHLVSARGVALGQILVLTHDARTADELRLQLNDAMGADAAAGARVTIRTRLEYFSRLVENRLHLEVASFEEQMLAVLRAFGHVGIRRLWEEYRENREAVGQLARFGDFRTSVVGVLEAISRSGHVARVGTKPDQLRALLDELAHSHRRYLDQLSRGRRLDYPSALRRLADVLVSAPDEAVMIRRRAPWLLVDEYQELLRIEHELLRVIHGPTGNVMAAGDENQCASASQGADPSCLTAFAREYPGAVVHALDANFRSTRQLAPAIARLTRAKTKSTSTADGDIPYLLVPDSAESAARGVAIWLRELKGLGKIDRYRQCALIVDGLEPYREAITRTFAEYEIPIRFDSMTAPESAHALQALLALLAAVASDELPGNHETGWSALFTVALDSHGPVRKPAVAELLKLRARLREARGDHSLLVFFHHVVAEYGLSADGRSHALVGAAGLVSRLLEQFERDGSSAGINAQRLRDFLELVELLEPVVETDPGGEDFAWVTTPARAKGAELEAVAVFFHDPKGAELAPGLVEQCETLFGAGRAQEARPTLEARRRFLIACSRARRALLCVETADYGDVSPSFAELGAAPYSRKRKQRVVELKPVPPRERLRIGTDSIFQYRTCPKLFHLRSRMGFRPALTAEAREGADLSHTMRRALDRLHQLRIETRGDLPNERLPEIFRWSLPSWVDPHADATKELGRRFVRYGSDTRTSRGVIDYARELVVPIGPDLVSGRVDLVQRSLERADPRPVIVEIKLSETPASRARAELELGFLRLAYRAPEVELETYFLEEGRRVKIAERKNAGKELEATLARLARGEFAPKPEREKCAACPMLPLCAEGQETARGSGTDRKRWTRGSPRLNLSE
jgi:superfamily I DNA/RNA helicase